LVGEEKSRQPGTAPETATDTHGKPSQADAKNLRKKKERTEHDPEKTHLVEFSETLDTGSGKRYPLKARVAYKSEGGQEPGYKKTNQDICFSANMHGTKLHLFGVLDGHGPNGHHVSSFVKDTFPKGVASHPLFRTHPGQALKETFLSTHTALLKTSIDCDYSGCTAAAVLMDKDKLYCGWVGDTRVVVGRRCNDGRLQTVALTVDHKPDQANERVRIEKSKGRVARLVTEKGEQVGPHRVWLKYAWVPGLAMSRALGDVLASRIGVTCEPDMNIYHLTAEDKYLIMASDGVCDTNQPSHIQYKPSRQLDLSLLVYIRFQKIS
jgi:serine/threonine protein phosphatase PrpC